MTALTDMQRLAAQALTCALKGRDVTREDLDTLERLAEMAGVDGQQSADALLVLAARVAVSKRCRGFSSPALDAAARVYLEEVRAHAPAPDPKEPSYYWQQGSMA